MIHAGDTCNSGTGSVCCRLPSRDAKGAKPIPLAAEFPPRGSRPAVPMLVTEEDTSSATTTATAASTIPLRIVAVAAPSVRRPLSPSTASSSAYSTAGPANACQGSIPRSIDAGTEYMHSRGRATSAGARHTAISMSTISAVRPTASAIRNASSVDDAAGDTEVRICSQAPSSRSPASATAAALGITPP